MLSLRQKIAQLLIVGFDGSRLVKNSDIYNCIKHNGIGGVLLFDKDLKKNTAVKNITDAMQVTQLNADIRDLCFDSVGIEPIISVDFEGGAVNRFENIKGSPIALSAQDMALLSENEFEAAVEAMAKWLIQLGFNMNFAPVVDLGLEENHGIIAPLKRSFSKHASEVSQLAWQFCKINSDSNIGTCYKHFPGHGSAATDSHKGFVDVTASFNSEELLPYTHLKNYSEYPIAVMTAHVINKNYDNSATPASLSYPILQTLLREQLGYNGLIISDDLQMRAVSDHYSIVDAMVQALNAGCDMLIIGNQLGCDSPQALILALEQAIQSKKLSPARVDSALQRVCRYKSQIECRSELNLAHLCH